MKRLTVSLVAVLMICAGCSGPVAAPSPATPTTDPYPNSPPIYLIVDGQRITGGALLFEHWHGGPFIDYNNPQPEATYYEVGAGGFTLELGDPLPENLAVDLSIFSQDGHLTYLAPPNDGADLSPVETVMNWNPDIPPGNYILGVNCSWPDDSQVNYWFAVKTGSR